MTRSHQDIQSLLSTIQDLSSEQHYDFTNRVVKIADSLFGGGGNKGMLSKLSAKYSCSSPLSWFSEMKAICGVLGAESTFFGSLLERQNNPIYIDKSKLPACILSQFPEEPTKYEYRALSIKREVTGLFSISFLNWYFVRLLVGFVQMDQSTMPFSEEKEMYLLDQYFHGLTRNVYLVLMRSYLEFARKTGRIEVEKKLGLILESVLVRQLTSKYDKRFEFVIKDKKHPMKFDSLDTSVPQNYKLKTHYFQAIYLYLIYKPSSALEQSSPLLYRYIDKVSENYSLISTYNPNLSKIPHLVRLLLLIATRKNSIQRQMPEYLSKSNEKDGYYKLEKYSLEDYEHFLDHSMISASEITQIEQTQAKIVKLLQKLSEWQPDLRQLRSLQYLMLFDSHLCKIKANVKRHHTQPYLSQKYIETIKESLIRIFRSIRIGIYQESEIILLIDSASKRFQKTYNTALDFNIQKHLENLQGENKYISKTRQSQKSLINHSQRRYTSAWDYPIQSNEWYFLYAFFYFISKQIDKIIPGSRKKPAVNLRVLSNPFALLVLMGVIYLMMKFF